MQDPEFDKYLRKIVPHELLSKIRKSLDSIAKQMQEQQNKWNYICLLNQFLDRNKSINPTSYSIHIW